MDDYIKEPRYNRFSEPLTWWQCHMEKFNLLVGTAKKYLIIPASSATSEREFKKARDINLNREQLCPKNLEMLLFLKYNLRALNYDVTDLQLPPEEFTLPNDSVLPAPVFAEPTDESSSSIDDEQSSGDEDHDDSSDEESN